MGSIYILFYNAIHDFSVWIGTGYNLGDISNHAEIVIFELYYRQPPADFNIKS